MGRVKVRFLETLYLSENRPMDMLRNLVRQRMIEGVAVNTADLDKVSWSFLFKHFFMAWPFFFAHQWFTYIVLMQMYEWAMTTDYTALASALVNEFDSKMGLKKNTNKLR